MTPVGSIAPNLGLLSKALPGPVAEHLPMSRHQARTVEGRIRVWVLERERERRIERRLAAADSEPRRH